MRERDIDYCFKFVLVGDLHTGKTSLIRRFVDDTFVENTESTVGIDFKIKTININGLKVKLQLWDTAGQERFKTITNSYLRGAHAVLIVYDCNNKDSIQSCLDWIRDSNNVNVRCIVGNKSDLNHNSTLGKELAEKHNIFWFEVSAKTDHYVGMMFYSLAERCILTMEKLSLQSEKQNVIHLASKPLQTKEDKKRCCN